MSKITLKGNEIELNGTLPQVGDSAPNFSMVKDDLSEADFDSMLGGKNIVLSVFPSVDTPTCANSVRNFNKKATELENTVVLNVSKDLPFAFKRFCAAEGIENVSSGSVFRSDFAKSYGLEIGNGPLKGLCTRAVFVIDPKGKIAYQEVVSEIADEPNYDDALEAAEKL